MFVAWVVGLSLLVQADGNETLRMAIDEGMQREGVTAEYLSAPPGEAASELAHDVIVGSGLTQWDGSPPLTMAAPSGYRLMAVVSGDGRSVSVTYRPETHGSDICVVRAAFNGTGSAAYRASRWCAAKFGIDLPEVPPPPIR